MYHRHRDLVNEVVVSWAGAKLPTAPSSVPGALLWIWDTGLHGSGGVLQPETGLSAPLVLLWKNEIVIYFPAVETLGVFNWYFLICHFVLSHKG